MPDEDNQAPAGTAGAQAGAGPRIFGDPSEPARTAPAQPPAAAGPLEPAAVPGGTGQPPAADPELSDRAAELTAELADIQAKARPGRTVTYRVKAPHESFTVGGVTVTSDPTPVPESAVGRLTGAAAEAGVTLEEA